MMQDLLLCLSILESESKSIYPQIAHFPFQFGMHVCLDLADFKAWVLIYLYKALYLFPRLQYLS